jgi:hypothetical protein
MSSFTASIARRLAAVNRSHGFPSSSRVAEQDINKINYSIDFIDSPCYKLLTREGGFAV